MKRRDFITVTGKSALLATMTRGCLLGENVPNSRHLVDTPEKRATYLTQMLKVLCTDIGPHPIGSSEYDTAAHIVKKEMERALPNVIMDTFPFERWVILSEPELYVGDQRLETFPGHGTQGTPPGDISGRVKRIDEDGIPYGVIDDTSGTIRAYITTSRYGKAVPLPYYSFNKEVKCLPTFNIGIQDIPVVEAAISWAKPVRLHVQVDFIPDTISSNVIGILPGKSKEEIVFIAHLDTVYSSPGANDNTASVITMLMLAHAESGNRPQKTMTFIATSGEEYGKLGAIHYAEHRKSEETHKNIKFIVNFDSLTWGPHLYVNSHDEELRKIFQTIDRELNIKGSPVLNDTNGFALDAQPFLESGARAVYVNSRGYNLEHLWHRPEDTADTVPVDCVEIGFQMFHEFIRRVQEL